MHILLPVTDNCPSWKNRLEKRKYVARPGMEPRTPDESGALPIALRGPAAANACISVNFTMSGLPLCSIHTHFITSELFILCSLGKSTSFKNFIFAKRRHGQMVRAAGL